MSTEMIKLTGPEGKEVEVDGLRVTRVRKAFPNEHPGTKTRVDWDIMSLVKEEVDKVVRLVRQKLPSLTVLTGREGLRIWIDARKATGPFPVQGLDRDYGFRSAIRIPGERVMVIESPEEVRTILAEARGRAAALEAIRAAVPRDARAAGARSDLGRPIPTSQRTTKGIKKAVKKGNAPKKGSKKKARKKPAKKARKKRQHK